MTIVCGTDFSERSLRAETAAARLAARMHVPLHLVHAMDLPQHARSEEMRETSIKWAQTLLLHQAEQLRRLGAEVSGHVKLGVPDEALLEAAREFSAKLVVVAALGQRETSKWQLGSHADRLAQAAHVPVLVVRDPDAFEAWVDENRPLSIVLGGDHSQTSSEAARWIKDLCQWGPCTLTVVHLYWPPEQFQRLGLRGVRSYVDSDPEVTQILEREFAQGLADLPKSLKTKFRFDPHLGRVGDRLAKIAEQEKADILVVGSHPRNVLGRLWEGSVSRDALRQAKVSVVCVPTLSERRAAEVPRMRSVLVATDFSDTANSAVPLAYSIVCYGGDVHLLHVAKGGASSSIEPSDLLESSSSGHPEERAALLALIPPDASQQGKHSNAHVVASNDPARAIAQVAERLGVDAICLGTHGRTGLQKVLLGSVAQGVLGCTQRPLLFAHAARV
jgi:nucleotide-binding universal stress UspA family protein